jgi:integrase
MNDKKPGHRRGRTPSARKDRGGKRGNGEGTIYQRQSDGKWCASVSLDGGRRKVLYGKTRQEVARKLAAALRDVQMGMPLPGDRLTLERFLLDRLATTVKPSRSSGTYLRYEAACRLHIIPQIGRVPLTKVGPAHIQKVQSALVAASKSAATISLVRACLCSALTRAEKWQLVQRNVVPLTEAPRSSVDEPQPLTPEQAQAFLHAAAGHEFEHLFTVMLATGLRIGEALGLQWSAVNLESTRLQVRKQLIEIPRQPRRFGEPKSASGKRSVPLIPAAIAALHAQRARVLQYKLVAGSAWQDQDLVFPDYIGRFLVSRRVDRVFKSLLGQAGLATTFTPHSLRHSTGTYLTARGVPDRVVMEMLGHSSLEMTRRYQHVMSSMLNEAAEQLASIFPS